MVAPGIQAGDSILLTIYYAPGSHTSRFTAQALSGPFSSSTLVTSRFQLAGPQAQTWGLYLFPPALYNEGSEEFLVPEHLRSDLI